MDRPDTNYGQRQPTPSLIRRVPISHRARRAWKMNPDQPKIPRSFITNVLQRTKLPLAPQHSCAASPLRRQRRRGGGCFKTGWRPRLATPRSLDRTTEIQFQAMAKPNSRCRPRPICGDGSLHQRQRECAACYAKLGTGGIHAQCYRMTEHPSPRRGSRQCAAHSSPSACLLGIRICAAEHLSRRSVRDEIGVGRSAKRRQDVPCRPRIRCYQQQLASPVIRPAWC